MRIVSEYNDLLRLKGFNAFAIEEDSNVTRVYSRKDFYKICLTTGKSIIHYADKSYREEGTILFFGNPMVPYSWETLSRDYVGFTCLFSEEFYNQMNQMESLLNSPLFKIAGTPIVRVYPDQRELLNGIFKKIIAEQDSNYLYKDDLIRTYINLILHESLKMHPSENFYEKVDASARLASVFFELLERQFPIVSLDKPLQLKSPADYAASLSVHVNYLNRTVKKVTGKPTSIHIIDRIVVEAKAMLKHTDWTAREIAHILGFEYPTYFNNFFKKQTGSSPQVYRKAKV